jgi:hypothetical protein
LEDSSDLLPGLAAELTADRGRIKAHPDLFLVDFEVCLFVFDGVDIVAVMGCSVPSTGYLRSP